MKNTLEVCLALFSTVKKLCQVGRKIVSAGLTGKKSDIWIITKLHDLLTSILAVKVGVVFLAHP